MISYDYLGFSGNSKAFVWELLEEHEEVFHQYYIYNDIITSSTSYYNVICREEVKDTFSLKSAISLLTLSLLEV